MSWYEVRITQKLRTRKEISRGLKPSFVLTKPDELEVSLLSSHEAWKEETKARSFQYKRSRKRLHTECQAPQGVKTS